MTSTAVMIAMGLAAAFDSTLPLPHPNDDGGTFFPGMGGVPRPPKEPSFPQHELDALAQLHGKAKKQRVRELKAKYGAR